MGAFYESLFVPASDRQEVVRALNEANLEALVTPERSGCVVVYAPDLEGTGKQLSVSSPCLMLMLHDDDVLLAQLYRDGTVVDDYDSWPGYFHRCANGEQPTGGDAASWCGLFGVPNALDKLDGVLRAPSGQGGMDATERMRTVLELLGAPVRLAYSSFRYVEGGEYPEGLKVGQLIRTGD